MSNIVQGVQEYIPTLLQLIGAILGILAVSAVNKFQKWIVSKISKDTYERAVDIAKGIYILLEDEYEGKQVSSSKKREDMKEMLLRQFPNLTETELNSINKIVWEAFNQKYQEGYISLEGIEDETEEDLNEEDEECNI